MVGRKVYVEIGDSMVSVAIDENTRARDIKRQLGAEDYNPRVNGDFMIPFSRQTAWQRYFHEYLRLWARADSNRRPPRCKRGVITPRPRAQLMI